MKRTITKRRARRVRSYDSRKDLSKDTLAGIGAVALAFNDLQAMLEILVCVCLDINPSIWREFCTRLGGIEDKIALIKFGFKNVFSSAPDIHEMTENTLASVSQYKGYRDSIIHSRVIDIDAGIAEMTFRRNKIEEILITEEALNSLYDHILVTIQEIRELISLMEAVHTMLALQRKDLPPPF